MCHHMPILLHHFNCMVWTLAFTGATTTAFGLCYVSGEWLQCDMPGIQKRKGCCRSCTTLCNAVGYIFWTLAGTRQIYTICSGFHGCQLGMFFKEETIRTPTDAEGLCHLCCVCLRLKPCNKRHHIAVILVHISPHIIAHQLCQLKRIHAAHSRAVFVIFFVSAANTMHDGDAFRFATILEPYLADGWPAGGDP